VFSVRAALGANTTPEGQQPEVARGQQAPKNAVRGLGGRLDVEVRVVNINKGRNVDMVSKCRDLSGYAAFVDKVREYQTAGLTLNDALKKAIDYCVNNGILEKFLSDNSTEVRSMLITEWNLEDAKAAWREEALEEGIEKGMEKGMEKGKVLTASKIFKLLGQGLTAEQIAKELNLPVNEAD
jgi:hypothetical protein